MIMNGMSRKRQDGNERIEYSTKDSNKRRGGKSLETVVSLLKQVAFIMFIISQPCSLELCLYKVKRGNFGITVQKYPHTTTYNTQSPTPIYNKNLYK